MRISRSAALGALAAACIALWSPAQACTNLLGGPFGAFSLQRSLGTENADNVQITGGCIDGYTILNLFQNGNFVFDKRHEGATVTVGDARGPVMGPDRWQAIFNSGGIGGSGAGAPTIARAALSAGLTLTSKEALLTMGTPASSASNSGLLVAVQQQVAGQDLEDAGFGAGGGQYTNTLSKNIWLKSSVGQQTVGVYAQNAALTRSYVSSCFIGPAATWVNCNFVIPADGTGGAGLWNTTPGSIGLIVGVAPACGANFQAPTANLWTTGNFYCIAGETQLTNTPGATFEMAAAGLYRGAGVWQTFQPEPYQLANAKVRMFFRSTFPDGVAPAPNAGRAGALCTLSGGTTGMFDWELDPVPMFAAPTTITTYNPNAANSNWRDVTKSLDMAPSIDPAGAKSQGSVAISGTSASAAAGDVMCIHATLDTGL